MEAWLKSSRQVRSAALRVKSIQIKVKPNARVSSLQENLSGPWLAQLKSPPVDGKANQELISLLAEHFVCPKSPIHIKNGQFARLKLVCIET